VKQKVMYAIVGIQSDELAMESKTLGRKKPAIFASKKEADSEVCDIGRIAKVIIKEMCQGCNKTDDHLYEKITLIGGFCNDCRMAQSIDWAKKQSLGRQNSVARRGRIRVK
jgi:hypothetical protein